MIQKIRQNLKEFFSNPKELISFLGPLVLALILIIPTPYTVTVGGGTLNIDKKIKIDNSYENKGSLNAAYVKELDGTVLTYLLSKIINSYKLNKIEEVTLENENVDDYNFREKMYFTNSTENALKSAFTLLNKEVTIKDEKVYVLYITKEAKTNLKVQDQIIKVNGIEINNTSDINNIIKMDSSTNLAITVIRDDKEIECFSSLININGEKKIGIYLTSSYTIETNSKVEFNFSDKEIGPSGGLMIALSIYNKLVSEDITKGKKIVGTGTIDEDGKVGEIGGIIYKLNGAVKSRADIFLCPKENYAEAINLKNKYNYNIKIYGVSTFKESLEILKNS